jgi:UDP-N-acetylmuramoylalanine--D-glutamate ligase
MEIAGKKVTIIGGKRSGMALARLVVRLNGNCKLSEKDDGCSLPRAFRAWAEQHDVIFEFNGHTPEFIGDSDMIVLSPGVPFDAPCVRWAKEKNICVLGEIEFASQYCSRPIIAVTGSNGKTTVATLISKVLQKAGYNACLCGNVGFPFSEFVLDLDQTDFVVLEVSSFQLESVHDSAVISKEGLFCIDGFKPHIAVILNFSQNHLDRHNGLEEYFSSKKRIFINQGPEDFLVLNHNDLESRKVSPQAKPRIVYFNSPENNMAPNPNYSAVLSVSQILKIDKIHCDQVLKEFKGVEHRLEKVRSLNGVDFINDSKATTAQAALWALENIDQPIVMICGGRDKNIDFTVLSETVRRKVKQMLVIGEARAKIRQAFDDLVNLEECERLEDAVAKARQIATKGDCVLLSPMCASFDMFADFEERGRVFKEIVNQLK